MIGGVIMKKEALEYLNQDPILNIDMIEIIQHEPCKILYASSLGVLLFSEYAKVYMLSVSDDSLGYELINQMDFQYGVTIHQPQFESYIQARKQIQERLECYQMVYPKKEIFPMDNTLKIIPLTLEDLDFVCQHYGHSSDLDYITEIIQSGWLYKVEKEGQIAGFIGRHHEGSIGLLEVLQEYRRLHLGSALLKYMMNIYLIKGWTPYSQVVVGNDVSYQLHLSLGFIPSTTTVIWLM